MANLKRINELPDATEFSASDKIIIDTPSGVKRCSADIYNGKCDIIIRATRVADAFTYELVYGSFDVCSTLLDAANRRIVGIICGESENGSWQESIESYYYNQDGSICMESYGWTICINSENVVSLL